MPLMCEKIQIIQKAIIICYLFGFMSDTGREKRIFLCLKSAFILHWNQITEIN